MKSAVALLVAALATAAEKPPGKQMLAGPLELSLKRAVDIAVAPEGSAKVQLAVEAQKQAESRSAESRAALLPDLSAAVSAQNLTRNLAAFGFQIASPIPGFQI